MKARQCQSVTRFVETLHVKVWPEKTNVALVVLVSFHPAAWTHFRVSEFIIVSPKKERASIHNRDHHLIVAALQLTPQSTERHSAVQEQQDPKIKDGAEKSKGR